MDKEFNLLNEPWIRVINERCEVQEVSITDALLKAHEFTDLCGELPTQDIAILRLLLAILHTVFSRVDAQGRVAELEDEDEALERWKELWDKKSLPKQPILNYLQEWHDRFWLFHPERPFWQVAELESGTEYGASKLNGELSESGNKQRLFSFCSGNEKEELSYSQAARWLFYVNAYDDTSGKPTKKGKEKAAERDEKLPSPGAGWLGRLGLVTMSGKNLFETLMLNLVLWNGNYSEGTAEKPIWERSKAPSEERVQIAVPDNLSELYTLQSRRILLQRNKGKVKGYLLMGGNFFEKENAFIEPLTIWRKQDSKKEEIYSPCRHDASKQIWREFSGLYTKSSHKPGVIVWVEKLIEHELISRSSFLKTKTAYVQYGGKDFFVTNVSSDSLSMHSSLLSEIGTRWQGYIVEEIKKCDRLARAISDLASDLHLASGGDKSKENLGKVEKEQLYYRIDEPFRVWINSIDPSQDESFDGEKIMEWQEEAKKTAFKLSDEMLSRVNEQAYVGRWTEIKKGGKAIKKHHSAPEARRTFANKVFNIYNPKGGKGK